MEVKWNRKANGVFEAFVDDFYLCVFSVGHKLFLWEIATKEKIIEYGEYKNVTAAKNKAEKQLNKHLQNAN